MHCTVVFSISNLKLVNVAHVNTAQQLLGITAEDAAVPVLFIYHHFHQGAQKKNIFKNKMRLTSGQS